MEIALVQKTCISRKGKGKGKVHADFFSPSINRFFHLPLYNNMFHKETTSYVRYMLLVFRRKILCDAKPKLVSRTFRSKRGSLPQTTKLGGGEGELPNTLVVWLKLPIW